MNDKQRENLAKLCFDLVKIPTGLCMVGPLINEVVHFPELLFFGSALALGLIYAGHVLEETI